MSTITIDRSVVEQALEAFDVATTPLARDRQEVLRAQAALRAALEQPQVEQEPVAWMNAARDMSYLYGPYHADDIPLYTNQKLKREPLTYEQIAKTLAKSGLVPEDYKDDGDIIDLVRAVEAAHDIGGEK